MCLERGEADEEHGADADLVDESGVARLDSLPDVVHHVQPQPVHHLAQRFLNFLDFRG